MILKYKIELLIIIIVGILLGMLIYLFKYANGASYLSSDPNACINCHIMEPQFDSWKKSSHHSSASCVDCHLPHETIKKWIAKAENGFLHSKAFTLQNFHEPIMIKDKNKNILQKNCIQCHDSMTDDITNNHYPIKNDCLHCHSSVGHSNQIGMGKFTKELK